MKDYKVSYRYAASLIGMAEEKNILAKISEDFEFLNSTLKSNPQLSRMLENPVIKPEIKKSVLEEVFASSISMESMNFLGFIIHKNREDLIPGIVLKFLEMRDERLGIVNVLVKTAFEFNIEQKEQLKTKMESFLNKKVRLEYDVDKNMVGGFIARVADTVYDASVRHQLDQLKKQFLSGSAALN